MFESAKRKLERADKHVRDFDEVFTAFVNRRPHRPILKAQRKEGNVWRLWVEVVADAPLPPDLAMILGDAVHNFRCVLDHLMWELTGLDGGTQNRHTKFPVGRTRVDFEATARGVITPSQAVKEFLVDLAVYPSGQGELFYGIHALDNADKHTVLTPVMHASYVDSIVLINLATGARELQDPIYVRAVKEGGNAFAYEAPEGFGIDADHMVHPTPDVFFPEVDIFPDEPIIPTLARMSYEVEGLINEFEWFMQRLGRSG